MALTLADLSKELTTWQKEHNYVNMYVPELLKLNRVTQEEKAWLIDFNSRWTRAIKEDKTLLWVCKYCGETEIPSCPKCVREDGKLITDELVRD